MRQRIRPACVARARTARRGTRPTSARRRPAVNHQHPPARIARRQHPEPANVIRRIHPHHFAAQCDPRNGMVESQSRNPLVGLAEARHQHQARLNPHGAQQRVEQVGLVLAIPKLVLQDVRCRVGPERIDPHRHRHVTQPGHVIVQRQHLLPVLFRVLRQLLRLGGDLRGRLIRQLADPPIPLLKPRPIGERRDQQPRPLPRRHENLSLLRAQILEMPRIGRPISRLLQGGIGGGHPVRREVESHVLRQADLHRRIQRSQVLPDRYLKRDLRQRERLPGRPVTHVQHRPRPHAGKGEELALALLVISHRLLMRVANRVRVQPHQLAIRAQHLAVQESDVFERRRIADVEIAVMFPLRRQDLHELLLLRRDGRAASQCVAQPPPQDDGIGLRILLRLDPLDLLPHLRQVASRLPGNR